MHGSRGDEGAFDQYDELKAEVNSQHLSTVQCAKCVALATCIQNRVRYASTCGSSQRELSWLVPFGHTEPAPGQFHATETLILIFQLRILSLWRST